MTVLILLSPILGIERFNLIDLYQVIHRETRI
jgi:hypothetical protein